MHCALCIDKVQRYKKKFIYATPQCRDVRLERPNEQSESKSACRVRPRPHRGRTATHKNATSIVMIEVALYFCVYVNYVNLYLKIDYKIRLVVVACALVV
jgi:hypothetical protein